MIDWAKPIEAAHEDGRVQSVVFVDYNAEGGSAGKPDASGDYYTSPVDGTIIDTAIWYPDGSTWAENSPGWHIRNRAETTNDELAELRAFREAAIARFPELAEPETDEEAAARIYGAVGEQPGSGYYEAIFEAIAWARANPR